MPEKIETIEDMIAQSRKRLQGLYTYIKGGVNIIDPLTTYIAEGVSIGEGTTIYPLCVIEDDVEIGKNCKIGPFARLRPGTRLKDEAVIGNFVEVNRSTLSKKSKAKHLTYLGDTIIEENVNVGAGTIVANYDGKQKHQTHIKAGAFIGSGTILIAPVTVGKDASTGAGSVVTRNHNVPDKSVVVGIPARVLKRKEKD
jgi:bifunctional UDP-N-acetylglucosamine pyrophosphorylase/glucosamine-1-phosphate N-acetyltransferase